MARFATLMTTLLFAIEPVFAKDDERTIEYEKLNKLATIVQQHIKSPLADFSSTLSIKKEGVDFSDIKLWLSHNGEKIQNVAFDGQGLVQLPVIDAHMAEDTLLHINQPKGAVALNISVGIKTLESKEVPYRDVFSILADTNYFTKQMAGAMSFFVSEFDELVFTFAKPAAISMMIDGDLRQYSSDTDHQIELMLEPKLMTKNPTMVFSELPTEITPDSN